ncbi:MAG: MFS transporter [Chloroflexi bacterium]|nr:MFS transporter [Chloroflexota bacterium]
MISTVSASAAPVTGTCDRWVPPTLALVTFLSSLAGFALGPFLPIIARDLTVSVVLLGQLPAISALVAAGLGLVAGPLADQRGYRRTLLVALGCLAASAIGIGLAPGYSWLLLAFLIGAVSRASATPAAQAVISTRFTGATRRRAMS